MRPKAKPSEIALPRAIARALGRVSYTGADCEAGHGGERHTATGYCVECTRLHNLSLPRPQTGRNTPDYRAKQKIWKAQSDARIDPKERKDRDRKRREADAALVIACAVQSIRRSRVEICSIVYFEAAIILHARRLRDAEASRLHREADREGYRERDRARVRDPLELIAKSHAYRARKRGAEGSHTADDLRALIAAHGGLCAYCPEPYAHIDHMTPLVRGGSNWPSNLQPLCEHHNTSKLRRTDEEFRAWKGWPAQGRCIAA